ncbi:MAG: hypothetical protein LE169_05990 [Endomicrobium sp.]|nr:hypothetical protein [Endomicrobium sp.]
MKRNIVILLCLVFFTQSAFADWSILCGDCQDESNACSRELGTCRRNNGNCQELRKADTRKIAELEDKVKKLEAQNKNLKIGTGVGVGVGAIVVGYIGYAIAQPFRVIRDLLVRLLGIVEPAADEDQA